MKKIDLKKLEEDVLFGNPNTVKEIAEKVNEMIEEIEKIKNLTCKINPMSKNPRTQETKEEKCCEKCRENPPSGDDYCTAKGCKCHSPESESANFMQLGNGHCFICHKETTPEQECIKEHRKDGDFKTSACVEKCGKWLKGNSMNQSSPSSEVEDWEKRWDAFMMKFVFNEENVKSFIRKVKDEAYTSGREIALENNLDILRRFKKDIEQGIRQETLSLLEEEVGKRKGTRFSHDDGIKGIDYSFDSALEEVLLIIKGMNK